MSCHPRAPPEPVESDFGLSLPRSLAESLRVQSPERLPGPNRAYGVEDVCLQGANSAFPPSNIASFFHLGVLQKTLRFFLLESQNPRAPSVH